MKDREVVLIDGARTAFGRLGGSLKDFTAEELGSIALKGLIDKTKICERGKVDSVFAGSAFHMARAINPARWIVLDAGLPVTTTASYVEMQCGSAIDGINLAAWKILCGHADVIIAGGFNIFPKEIDEILFGHPKVLEACCIGVADSYRGETVKAYIVLKPGESMDANELIAYCKEQMAPYKVPTHVEFIDELPKSAIGKILRRELREMDRKKREGAV